MKKTLIERLREIRRNHASSFHKPEPMPNYYILNFIFSGQTPELRKPEEICNSIRSNVARNPRCSERHADLIEVFVPPKSYVDALRFWSADKQAHDKQVAGYLDATDKAFVSAPELPDSEFEATVAHLMKEARSFGLIG